MVTRAKKYKRVEAFYMYFLPNLDYNDWITSYIKKQFGITPYMYPHWSITRVLAANAFRATSIEAPKLKLTDIECKVRKDTGLEWICYGDRISDNRVRRYVLKSFYDEHGVSLRYKRVCPIKDWSDSQVLSYCRSHNLRIPDVSGLSTGVGIGADDMRWIKKYFPADYDRILEAFPYAEAQLLRFDHKTKGAKRRVSLAGDVRFSGLSGPPGIKI